MNSRRAIAAAEFDVGDRAAEVDPANQPAVGIEAMHAVAGSAPQPAVFIATDAIGVARRDAMEHPPVRQRAALVNHIEDMDRVFRLGGELCPGGDEVQALLVRREGQAVRTAQALGDPLQAAVVGVDAIDRLGEFAELLAALVIRTDAIDGSVNQILPSPLQMTSLGEFSRLPSNRSAST